MEKQIIARIAVMIAVTLVIASILVVFITIQEQTPTVVKYDIYVDDDNTEGPWDGTQEHPYQFIQDAVENASEHDIVYILSGTYEISQETIFTIDKSISIIGEDKYDSIILDTSNSTDVYVMIYVSVSNVTFRNLSICSKYQFLHPITTIRGRYGIVLPKNAADNTKIINCRINTSRIGISVCSSNNTISDCIFNYSNDEGIFLWGHYNTVENCTFHNNTDGIELALGCSHNSISNCKFYDNLHGITFIDSAQNNSISNCSVYNSKGSGVLIANSHNNRVSNSKICKNGDNGIKIASSFGNTIVDCEISNNSYEGICIENSTDNEIYRCKIPYNIRQGIRVESDSTNNRFHHNILISNGNFTWLTPGEKQACDYGINQWDNGFSMGNYWSDYTELYPNATQIDGIWDTPYNVSGGDNRDMYPLINPVDT